MNNYFLFFNMMFFFSLHQTNLQGSSGSDSSQINSPDSIIFQTYLDSIEKYIYKDSRQSLQYKLLCEDMISNENDLSHSNLMGYAIQNIYYQYSTDSIIEVSNIIENNRKLLVLKDVSHKLKKDFQYLDAFTSTTLGDYESAQVALYELLETGIDQKDTSTMYKAMFTLGGLYETQNDLGNSELFFQKSYELAKIGGKTPSAKIHVLINLVDLYIKKEDLSRARYYNNIGLAQSDSLKLLDLKIDFLVLEIEILVKEDKLKTAETVFNDCQNLARLIGNDYLIKKCQEVYPNILVAKENYGEALNKYEQLIEGEENGQRTLLTLINYYKKAHIVAQKNNSPEKAYQYLLKYNAINDSLSIQEQKQKAQYWKIKFDADQKEKENTILIAQVKQEKTQIQLLLALASIFLLGTIFLFGIMWQKRKFTKKLQQDVKDRTSELEISNSLLSASNEELNQLTNILSHDLKEPIRSIVGFSSLAKKEIGSNARLKECLNFVNQSGQQLHQLIEDVSVFQNIRNSSFEKQQKVNLNTVLTDVKWTLDKLLAEKKAVVNSPTLPTIYTESPPSIQLVFRILIENGLQYNQNKTPIINIKYSRQENTHSFLFEDNGIGIATEFQGQIFDMFKRLNTREIYQGSGLGLSIVKKILTKLNGDIQLMSSAENEGSIFQINVPVLKQSEELHVMYS